MDMRGIHYDLDSLFPSEPDFLEEEELCLKDYEYLRRLYPKEVRLIASILEEYLDRYEYEGSPMYVQYPDAVTITVSQMRYLNSLPLREATESSPK